MHYYKRNLGDYAKKAGRLSMLQHGSYTLLIDACYDREQFPTMDEAIEWTWASTTEEVEAVSFVLRKFFVLEDGRYVQKRIQEEIAEYHGKADNNARIAREREAKRRADADERARVANGSCTTGAQAVNESPPNQEPITNNQEPITNKKKRAAPAIFPRPDDVSEQVWKDWCQHREKKKTTVTETVINEARMEAAKACITLERFLAIWSSRGSQGLQADWLKPHERGSPVSRQNEDANAEAKRLLGISTSEVIDA